MKEIFDDIRSEEFTTKEVVVFGLLAPIALVLTMGIIGALI